MATRLPPAMGGVQRPIQTSFGRVESVAHGEGRTTLLLHSFNAAGSGAELAPLAERLSRGRRVVLVDWLGFGTSERPDVDYGPELYEELLREILAGVVVDGAAAVTESAAGMDRAARPDGAAANGESIDVIALSLPSQYVAALAAQTPTLFRRIVLISPTGFGRFRARRRWLGRIAYRYLRVTGLGRALFAVLATPRVIGWFLRQIFAEDASMPRQYLAYCVATCREPGAWLAPLRFVTGLLDDPGAEVAYRRIAVPTLLVFGDHPRFTDPAATGPLLLANPALRRATVAGSGDLPQIERPEETAAIVEAFLDEDGE